MRSATKNCAALEHFDRGPYGLRMICVKAALYPIYLISSKER